MQFHFYKEDGFRLTQYITLPQELKLETVNSLINGLNDLPWDEEYFFDYGPLGSVEPFGMLVAGAAIRRFLDEHPTSTFRAINYHWKDYAAHMGFFKSIRIDYGKEPGEAHGSSTYVPITMVNVQDLRDSARAKGEHVGNTIERKSKELAMVLSQGTQHLADYLTFSIRELMRNIAEHSQSSVIWFAGQYWSSKDRVEIALLDEGIGISKHLSRNPFLEIRSDRDALLFSIEPGISGSTIPGRRTHDDDMWTNSGFGLYMTSSLCQIGGEFAIASGTSTLHLIGRRPNFIESYHKGTAVMMRLRVSNLRRLTDVTGELVRRGEAQARKNRRIRTNVTASKVSRILVNDQ